ncbi:MAG TPA: polyhydroxyalkanoate synthesis repressor PhaR [Candidatus Sulfotelmatobacter sp.]|nr:polyhydroxyalkanoate synthesis repressor PhaR [Candidatus Sulfotelmatobacter sp.]
MADVVLIKRYENRKLYDTSRSVYVTLEDIAQLIRDGKEIKVVDAKTNEDLTKNTLALIILEEERHKKNLLPLNFMYQLIKYGESVQGSFQEYLTTGFEALLAGQQEAQRRVQKWTDATLGKDQQEAPAGGESDQQAFKEELEALKRKMHELELRLKKKG